MNLQSGEHKPGQGTGAPGQGWKSFSLQRGVAPPSGEEAEHNGSIISTGSKVSNGSTVMAMKPAPAPARDKEAAEEEQEDPYGRCTNMRLTSFTETPGGHSRDPRLIDLSQSAASTGNLGSCAGQLPHPQLAQLPHPQQQHSFNTLPAHMSQQHGPGHQQPPHPHHPHNTLPARVNNYPQPHPQQHHHQQQHSHHHQQQHPHHQQQHPQQMAGLQVQPSGRHFKPFDHRKINPMADIQENPYEQQQYGPGQHEATYTVHHNTAVPHMPAELRHTSVTNYGPQHPQVLHHRNGV